MSQNFLSAAVLIVTLRVNTQNVCLSGPVKKIQENQYKLNDR